MRTRTRYTPRGVRNEPSVPYTWYNSNHSVYSNGNTGSIDVNAGGDYQIITDNNHPRGQTGYCDQTVKDYKVNHVLLNRIDNTSTGRYCILTGSSLAKEMTWFNRSAPPEFNPAWLVVSYPKTVDQLLIEAKHRFRSVNEVDSLLNILEAKQTLRSLLSVGRFLTAADQFFRRAKKGALLHKLKKGNLRQLSESYLGWNFGFAPLIGDIRQICKDLQTFGDDYKRYLSGLGKTKTATSWCVGDITFASASTIGSGYSPNPNPLDGSHWHAALQSIKGAKRVVGVKGKRDVTYKSPAFQKLDYLLRRYLSTGPVSLAWELTRFSFVVDWFVNLTDILDTADDALTGSRHQIEDAWWSESYEVKVSSKFHNLGNDLLNDCHGEEWASTRIKRYHRERLDPSALQVGLSGKFGKKQASLSLALLHVYVANLLASRKRGHF